MGRQDSDWWACPSCGARTVIDHPEDAPVSRYCESCDWSFTFPEASEVPTA